MCAWGGNNFFLPCLQFLTYSKQQCHNDLYNNTNLTVFFLQKAFEHLLFYPLRLSQAPTSVLQSHLEYTLPRGVHITLVIIIYLLICLSYILRKLKLPLYPQHVTYCSAHSRHSINIWKKRQREAKEEQGLLLVQPIGVLSGHGVFMLGKVPGLQVMYI